MPLIGGRGEKKYDKILNKTRLQGDSASCWNYGFCGLITIHLKYAYEKIYLNGKCLQLLIK